MSDKKQEIHVHHHYAAPRVKKGSPRRRPRRAAPKKKNEFKDLKKAISISVNIVEQLLRLK